MKKYLMRVECRPGEPAVLGIEGWYLQAFDFEHSHGLGHGTFTKDRSEAMHFENPGAVLSYWYTRSITYPTRADGSPNRPLTATSISVEGYEEKEDA